MKIELARTDDYEAICVVLAEVDAIHVEYLPDVFAPKPGPVRPRNILVARISEPGSAVLVAREGAEIVGVLEILMKTPVNRDGFVHRPVARIDNVVVRATHRGRGIGTQLVSHAEAWALEHGAVVTELHVWSFNDSARRLYERLGYATRSVRMERVLRSPDERPAPPP
ncbi:MAG TPA: GNAT family N-acetyltransferase [Labilithrix sp.]|nr:GNAT family N-acetyltransferase [Labilithrix sp.]